MPQKINIIGTNTNGSIMQSVNFLYAANGIKLRKQTKIDHQLSATWDYSGRFIYADNNGDNTQLAYLMANHGRIVMHEDGSSSYEYSLKDHLGNTRITFDENLNILQEDAYYPFGMNIAGLSSANSSPENKYKYNGKRCTERSRSELQDEFGLDWYDYGARMYDGSLGRWYVLDDLCETFPNWTPYRYGLNSPINTIDLGGYIEWPVKGNSAVNKKDSPNGGYGLTNTVVRTSLYKETRSYGTSPHIGIDYRADIGDNFYSLGDGEVIAVGSTKSGINFLTVQYGNGDKVRFMHIDGVADGIIAGTRVCEGQILGTTGNSGRYLDDSGTEKKYNPHLHMDATDKNGKSINPEEKNYGTVTSKEFFEVYNGDYMKLRAAKLGARAQGGGTNIHLYNQKPDIKYFTIGAIIKSFFKDIIQKPKDEYNNTGGIIREGRWFDFGRGGRFEDGDVE